jgi:hypothetical protein
VTLSATAKRKAMAELERVVIATTGDPRIVECRQVHQSLSLEFVSLWNSIFLLQRNQSNIFDLQVAAMSTKARKTIDKIDTGSFRPRKYTSRRGTHRIFSALPQPSFTTRYMPLDSVVLKQLMGLMVKNRTHPNYADFVAAAAAAARRTTPLAVMYRDFEANRAAWWSRIFDFSMLDGIQVPGAPLPGRTTQRNFAFYMSTDGVGCSFTFRRAARPPRTEFTPENVPVDRRYTDFVAIDPGVTDLWSGVRMSLTFADHNGDDEEEEEEGPDDEGRR